MVRFNCPSCKKLYSFGSIPIPDAGAEFLCARCNSKCLLTKRNDKIKVTLISLPEVEEAAMTQMVYDSYRPTEEESYSPEELERHLRGLIAELPVGTEYIIGVMEGPDRGLMCPVKHSSVVIGKTNCDVNLSDTNISREHCRIEIYGRHMIVLKDLDSTWGTYKNGKQITLSILRPGDKIQLGKTTLALILSKEQSL